MMTITLGVAENIAWGAHDSLFTTRQIEAAR